MNATAAIPAALSTGDREMFQAIGVDETTLLAASVRRITHNEAAERTIAAETLLDLTLELSRTRRERDAWISLALTALDQLAEVQRQLVMRDPVFAQRCERNLAALRADVVAAYDGQRVAPHRERAA